MFAKFLKRGRKCIRPNSEAARKLFLIYEHCVQRLLPLASVRQSTSFDIELTVLGNIFQKVTKTKSRKENVMFLISSILKVTKARHLWYPCHCFCQRWSFSKSCVRDTAATATPKTTTTTTKRLLFWALCIEFPILKARYFSFTGNFKQTITSILLAEIPLKPQSISQISSFFRHSLRDDQAQNTRETFWVLPKKSYVICSLTQNTEHKKNRTVNSITVTFSVYQFYTELCVC